jgi:glyoxylase I family protein
MKIKHVAFVSTSPEDDNARLIAAVASWVDEIKATDGTHLVMLRDPWGLGLQLCKRAAPLVRGLP